MKVSLDENSVYVKSDGTFDQRKAIINAGLKAAVCFKDGEITPQLIREESVDVLIKRGINTILSDHTTPSEQQNVNLEIVNIPKIICMILNNEHQYSACERSLRYTRVQDNPLISKEEVTFYEKWIKIFNDIITKKYFDFYRKFNKDDDKTKKAILKLAQENARYGLSVFMPTTLTYTVPLAQINKIYLYNEELINNPLNEFEKLIVPHLKELNQQLKDLKIIITEKDASELCPSLGINLSDKPLYKNNKHIELSLFAERNKFTGIFSDNQYGHSFNYNFFTSFASYAQFHRHRTVDFEMILMKFFMSYVPSIIKNDKSLTDMWLNDMFKLQNVYPQGQIILANANGSLKNLINYIGKERACEHAQLETQNTFMNDFLPDCYEGLVENNQTELADIVKPYVKKLRCAYPDYNCPKGCGHPRLERDL